MAAIALVNEKRSSSGLLVLPDGAEGRIDNGVVKYVGPDCKYVSIGDHIIFSGYSGTQLDIDGEPTLIILNEDFIVARIEDSDELVVRLDGKRYFYSEVADALAYAALQNKVPTSTRIPHGASKDDWKGST